MRILTEENTKNNIEDRITYVLSEQFNDNAPIGQEAYRPAAQSVVEEFESFNKNGSDTLAGRLDGLIKLMKARGVIGKIHSIGGFEVLVTENVQDR